MQEQQKVVTKQQTSRQADGAVVQENTRSVQSSSDSKSTAVNAVWYLCGLICIVLGIRFVLKLTGANPSNAFVDFVYAVSGVLSAPFDSIFGVTTVEGETVSAAFEPSILVAIAVYVLIAWGIVKLLRLNERPTA